MKEEIINIKNQAVGDITDAENLSELDEIRTKYLGRSGRLTTTFKNIKNVPKGQRKEVGLLINEAKRTLEQLIAEKKNTVSSQKDEWFDPTVPGTKPKTGNVHLITQTIDEISKIFKQIGFVRVRYPEVEWDWYAFGALNFPDEHPARDEWETFFIDEKAHKDKGPMLLTPHTSSGQIREMKRRTPPIRMINIAKTYRRQSDATHYPMFHQFEGLVIDKGINITHLKGTIDYFTKAYYGENAKSRIRPYDFQFTEPSFEVDFSCVHCDGSGCKFCKAGWHEVGGAGMVHPNVLKAGGIDPEEYTGFAFGWGVERTMMLKGNLGIDDLRTIYSTDINYLKQF